MKTETIEFVSGAEKEIFQVPKKNLVKILSPRPYFSDISPEELIKKSLEHPIESEPLDCLLQNASSVAIIVDDATRQTPTQLVLRYVIEKLKKVGIKKENVVIQIANGLHRLTNIEEKERICGEEVLKEFQVFDNDPNTDRYEYYGITSNGTPLYFNKRVTSTDFIIPIGMIKSHSFAGFTGGAKSIVPGISARETILANHRFDYIEYPNGTLGNCERSAVRRDMEEAASKLPLFIINVVLNKEGQIVDVVSGNVIAAHRKGVETFEKMASVYLNEPIDIAIIEGGLPGSISLYQAIFGCNAVLTTKRPILKKGGTIILFAPCYEGVGDEIIEELFEKYKDPTKVLNHLKNSLPVPGQWAAQSLAYFLLNSELCIVNSQISQEKLETLGITYHKSIQESLNFYLSKNERLKVAVIKDPDFLIPNLE